MEIIQQRVQPLFFLIVLLLQANCVAPTNKNESTVPEVATKRTVTVQIIGTSVLSTPTILPSRIPDSTATPTLLPSQTAVSITTIEETLPPSSVTPLPSIIERVSIVQDGVEANGASLAAALPLDGSLIAFVSYASNLVADDSANDCSNSSGGATSCADIFVRDLEKNETERISVSGDGTSANADSGVIYKQGSHVHISADGRFVTFSTNADNLILGVPSGQVYVYDRETRHIALISQTEDGTPGDGQSSKPLLSANGRYVAFESEATNLVPNDTNEVSDIFIYDRDIQQMERISVASDGTQANNVSGAKFPPSISADGRWVVFASFASNLVEDDTNESIDVFVHDREIGETERVSIASDGSQASYAEGSISIIVAVAISSDGRYVAFESDANNLVENDVNGVGDIFVHDRQTDQTEQVSISSKGELGNGLSLTPSISANGRYIAFASEASNLVARDTNGTRDIFVHDRQTGRTIRVNVVEGSSEANQLSMSPVLSSDGRWIAYASLADNLVPNDTNRTWDIFLQDLSILQQIEK